MNIEILFTTLSFGEISCLVFLLLMVLLWFARDPGFAPGYASLFPQGFVFYRILSFEKLSKIRVYSFKDTRVLIINFFIKLMIFALTFPYLSYAILLLLKAS